MPRPLRSDDLRQWQEAVDSVWGKLDVLDAAPAVGDWEVGDAGVLDAGGATASDYKLYVKVDAATIAVFSASALIT